MALLGNELDLEIHDRPFGRRNFTGRWSKCRPLSYKRKKKFLIVSIFFSI